MDDYIERQATIKRMKELHFGCKDFHICGGILLELNALEAIPPVDVRPVVRGEWENMNDDLDFHFRCSRCGEETWQTVMGKPRFKYCPMCGAYMRGENDE